MVKSEKKKLRLDLKRRLLIIRREDAAQPTRDELIKGLGDYSRQDLSFVDSMAVKMR